MPASSSKNEKTSYTIFDFFPQVIVLCSLRGGAPDLWGRQYIPLGDPGMQYRLDNLDDLLKVSRSAVYDTVVLHPVNSFLPYLTIKVQR